MLNALKKFTVIGLLVSTAPAHAISCVVHSQNAPFTPGSFFDVQFEVPPGQDKKIQAHDGTSVYVLHFPDGTLLLELANGKYKARTFGSSSVRSQLDLELDTPVPNPRGLMLVCWNDL